MLVPALLALALAPAVAACGGDDGGALAGSSAGGTDAVAGERVFEERGCTSCHSVTGDSSTGPHLDGIVGTEVEVQGGETVAVDDAYLERSIREPRSQVVDGFDPIMPSIDLSDDEVAALVAYIASLSD